MKPRQKLLVLFHGTLALAMIASVGLTGCPSDQGESQKGGAPANQPAGDPTGGVPSTIKVTSGAFLQGQPIPPKYKYSADGEDVSPPLSWSNLPEGTKELALICDDPDAPTAEPWVHWVIYKIPPDTAGLPEGIPKTERLEQPSGALQGKNDFPTIGYGGPAPPSGTHRYRFKLYALDSKLNLEPGLGKEGLLRAMEGHKLGKGELMGTYER